jgi:hypothetical protein
MIRIIQILFGAILLATQPITSTYGEEKLYLPADSKPFFIHKKIAGPLGDKTNSGFYCYLYEEGDNKWPRVVIYRVENDKVIDFVNQGTSAKDLMERIRKIHLKPFNYAKEVESTIARVKQEYKKEGKEYYGPSVVDGSSYEISYELDGDRLSFTAHEPGIFISELSEHSENLMKLHKVYNELMLYYAQRKLQFK